MCPSRESSRVDVPTQVCDRVTMLVRRLVSQCSGLIRKGAMRLTSVLESCGAPRGDSTSQTKELTKIAVSTSLIRRAGWAGEPTRKACTTQTRETRGRARSVVRAGPEHVAMYRSTSNLANRSTMCPSRKSSRVDVPTQVCDRVTMLVRRLVSQCSGLIRKGAMRLTSVLESCGAPRGDSTYLPFRISRWLLGMVVGPRTRL